MISAIRYHDISCGHRVVGHEGKCSFIHGHNYRVHFKVEAPSLDLVGRVIDFSVIKQKLCLWLESNWDHKFLAWQSDPFMRRIASLLDKHDEGCSHLFDLSVVWVPFNPTAENMAAYLINIIGPQNLNGTGCILTSVSIEETRKCSVLSTLD